VLPLSDGKMPQHRDVVINGDFEDIGPDPANPMLVGWTAINARPRMRDGQPVSTFFSGNVVAVLGSPNVSANASISQTVPVNGGCPYQLTFAGSGNPSGPIVTVQVGVSQQRRHFSVYQTHYDAGFRIPHFCIYVGCPGRRDFSDNYVFKDIIRGDIY